MVLALWTASLLLGCSSAKPYASTANKNLHLRTFTDASSLFSSLHAAVDMYRVGLDCRTDYEGTVQLNRSTTDVGIPSNQWVHLVFAFASASFWGNRRSLITYDTLLKPRPGYRYEMTVSYKNDMYNVVIREIQPNRSIGLELERISLPTCQSSLASS